MFPEKMGGIERVVFNLVLTKLGFWEMQRERERERERERSRLGIQKVSPTVFPLASKHS